MVRALVFAGVSLAPCSPPYYLYVFHIQSFSFLILTKEGRREVEQLVAYFFGGRGVGGLFVGLFFM